MFDTRHRPLSCRLSATLCRIFRSYIFMSRIFNVSYCRFEGHRWVKVGEAVSAATLSALIFISLIYAVPDCQPIRSRLNSTTPAANQSCLRDVTTSSSSLTARNTTDDDVIGTRDVTRGTPASTEEHDSYGYHDGHGYVFQVGNFRTYCCLALWL